MITEAQERLIKKIQSRKVIFDPEIIGHQRRSLRSLKQKDVVSVTDNGQLLIGEEMLQRHMDGWWSHIDLPSLIVLNYSGGKQSSCLLWMVLRGDLEVDKEKFVVMNADPGMENSDTYEYNAMMKKECEKAGIKYVTARGPNLYEDIVNLPEDATRLDNPPYWVKKYSGGTGRLVQKCTQIYKIAPMDREIRKILKKMYGISTRTKRMPENLVEKWIGFSYNEATRVKPSQQKYVNFRYPLIEMGMHDEDVVAYYENNNLRMPPRSVCRACFANGLRTFYTMHQKHPQDWEKAVNVDESVRDWSQIGIVEGEVYVSNTLVPLKDIGIAFDSLENPTDEELSQAVAERAEVSDLENDWSCDSGYCFV